MSALRIEKLSRQHAVEGFDCGREELNRYLVRFAWVNQQANAAQTYLRLTGDEVIGFYTLGVGEVAYDGAPQRLTKGLAKQPIGIMLLARFAVSLSWQGKRIGAGLLKDAMLRTMAAAEIAGIRALVVHAKDESAAAFYRRFDFSESPTDPRHLFVLIKDVKRALGAT